MEAASTSSYELFDGRRMYLNSTAVHLQLPLMARVEEVHAVLKCTDSTSCMAIVEVEISPECVCFSSLPNTWQSRSE
jgi:hypothetical protein